MKNSIYYYLGNHPPALKLFQSLESAGDLYLIGGVLREYRDHHEINSLRDMDIIIQVRDVIAWNNILETYSFYTNRFGGHKLTCDGLLIDVWPIEDTWAFRKHIIQCPPEEYLLNLPKTVFLNIDGIIYDWDSETWYDAEYQQALSSHILDVVLPQNPQIPLNILRAFVLADRYNLSFSQKLTKIIYQSCSTFNSLSDFSYLLLQEQRKRYGKDIFSYEEIQNNLYTLLRDYHIR